jgi:16S rRNA (cytosine1402-N4)-methyltransferase
MSGKFAHRPVLFNEVLEALSIKPDGIYVDGTFGRGGHAGAILERLDKKGRLLAIDKDPQAVAAAKDRFGDDPRFQVEQGSFTQLRRLVQERGWMQAGGVDGVLLDLGVSSPQLDDPERGFSFRQDGELDMRMDPNAGQSAAEWLARADEYDIRRVLFEFGEERFAKRIAHAIVKARAVTPIRTTGQLASLVREVIPIKSHEKGKDPATRTFQGIRIFINNELEDIKDSLPQAVEVLKPGGRLAVISFHSLEDRIVKRFLRDESRGDQYPPDLPIPQSALSPRIKLIGKAIRAGEAEVNENPRARSAVLRVAERLADASHGGEKNAGFAQ